MRIKIITIGRIGTMRHKTNHPTDLNDYYTSNTNNSCAYIPNTILFYFVSDSFKKIL